MVFLTLPSSFLNQATIARYPLGRFQLISQTRGSTTSYFLQDDQGSTRSLTNSGNPATVTDTYSYTAFGDFFSRTGTTTNPYQYTGQQLDSLTSLYRLRARYYNPALGRFLSQDTYPINFNNPVELNRYVYVANDPVNKMDPSGLSVMCSCQRSDGNEMETLRSCLGEDASQSHAERGR